MSQKGIIINTSDSGHVDASDHAILFKAIFGVGGILNVGKKLEISKVNNNKIRIYDGVYMMSNGVPIRIEEYEDLTVASGTLGYKRKDIVVAEYIKNGSGEENDIARIKIITGEYSVTSPTVPTLMNSSTTLQELLYTLTIEETTMNIDSKRPYILNGLNKAVFFEE